MSQNQAAQVARLPAGGVGFLNLDSAGNLLVALDGPAPEGAVSITGSSGNVAAGNAVATLAAAAGKTTYITGLLISGSGATAAGSALVTVSGLLGGSMTFVVGVPVGAGVPIAPINLKFEPPLPASAVNTAIVVTAATFGAGNTFASATAWGFQQ